MSTAPSNDLDTLVRRVDEDRWLASRFAPEIVRTRLMALYAANYEIARTAETVREAALGDMRLEWWRQGLEEIVQGFIPRYHPALAALFKTVQAPTTLTALQAVADARGVDLEAQPFATWDALERYVDITAGVVLRLACDACDITQTMRARDFITPAARAWGYAGLLRAKEFWRSRGRSALPPGGSETELLERAQANYALAKPLAPSLPSALFPAIGYIALLPHYLRALERGQSETPKFSRHAALITASATGRV